MWTLLGRLLLRHSLDNRRKLTAGGENVITSEIKVRLESPLVKFFLYSLCIYNVNIYIYIYSTPTEFFFLNSAACDWLIDPQVSSF